MDDGSEGSRCQGMKRPPRGPSHRDAVRTGRARLPGAEAARALAALVIFATTASLAIPAEPSPTAAARKSEMRVTRHFADGLEYLLVEPRDAAPDAELPMIVVLHGRGARPEPPTRPYLDLDLPVRVILPRAPLRSGDGYAWMPVSAHRGESPALRSALDARAHELAAAMATWRARHPTRGRPIVTGFSQGGILAATLALTHPDAIERAFPVAGWVPPSFEPARLDPLARQAPIHALHGARDDVLGAARTRSGLARLRAMGLPVVYEEIEDAGHEMHPRMTERLREEIRRALTELPDTSAPAGLS